MGIDVGTAITIVFMILSVMGSSWWLAKKHREDLSELKADVKDINEGLNNVKSTLVVVQTELKGHGEDLSELKADVKDNSERLNNVESALVGVQTDLKAQKERFDMMDDRFDRQEERHRDLEIQVGRVQGSLDVLIGYRRATTVAGRERTEQGERVGEPIGD